MKGNILDPCTTNVLFLLHCVHVLCVHIYIYMIMYCKSMDQSINLSIYLSIYIYIHTYIHTYIHVLDHGRGPLPKHVQRSDPLLGNHQVDVYTGQLGDSDNWRHERRFAKKVWRMYYDNISWLHDTYIHRISMSQIFIYPMYFV